MMSTDTTKPLVLVDGSSYLFRAYHALPKLTNTKGMPTGAIYGVLNMLRRLVKDYAPTHMAVVFDSKAPTFRKLLFPAYKAHREQMPDELAIQIAPLHEAIEALGIPLVVIPGVEADDIIATLAIAAEHHQQPVIISTGDKDLAQIVSTHITLINTMNNVRLDTAGVLQKFGIYPSQIVDYLALVGDSVDNIPGVPHVGPKTAAKWLNQYHSLENLIAHATTIPGKVGENLRQHLSELPLARQLVTVKTDVPLAQRPEELHLRVPQQQQLIALFTEFEFKQWLHELTAPTITTQPSSITPISMDYQIILTQQAWDMWLTQLQQAQRFSLDTETTALDPMQARLVGLSFAIEPGQAAYLPLRHDYLGVPVQLDLPTVLAQLQPILADPQKILIGQNLKYDLQILAHEHIHVHNTLWDSMLASYVLDSSSARHDLDTLALRHLQRNTIHFNDIAGKGSKQLTFNQIPLEQAGPYAAEDAEVALGLYTVLNPQLTKQDDLQRVFHYVEMPLVPILCQMERHGVLIDTAMLAQQSQVMQQHIEQIQAEVYRLAGSSFNLSSPKQLQTVLFEQLKLPTSRKTPTGQASTAEQVLQELASQYDIARLILEHRSLSKLKSTYTDRLPQQINPATGRVHTCYQQTGTVTGRLSSKDPNLQNIPIRSAEGRKIRQAFIAPPGYKIVSADYSQVELRIMAHLSQDPGLLQAFSLNQDVHRSTAAEIFNISLEAVTPLQRRSAKAINFGLMYGMSSFGLSQQLGISRSQAQRYMEIYFQRYPRVYDYMQQARTIAAKQGYVSTLYGRHVAVPDINISNQQRRQAAERAAINAPLQGSAADMIKLAMIGINTWLASAEVNATMILQVHDELVFEVAENQVEAASTHIRQQMENVIELTVPLVVDIGVGHNWDEAH